MNAIAPDPPAKHETHGPKIQTNKQELNTIICSRKRINQTTQYAQVFKNTTTCTVAPSLRSTSCSSFCSSTTTISYSYFIILLLPPPAPPPAPLATFASVSPHSSNLRCSRRPDLCPQRGHPTTAAAPPTLADIEGARHRQRQVVVLEWTNDLKTEGQPERREREREKARTCNPRALSY